MSGRFRGNLVWTCITTGALALGAGCATTTDDPFLEEEMADDELIEEQEEVLEPGTGGAGDQGVIGEEDDAGIIAPSEGVDDGLFEQGEGEDESMFEPGVGGAGDGLGDDEVDPDLAE
ncbi:hypothetical protein JQX13_38050 [Archangium violaceum]|uniref:hypothetical protein n=1 Tax=Archangium violaceum TaxID=83451 RepID=UPI00193B3CA4|nr:hypothetical protein [Archangium violaceum]QRK05900.1 hypothetical protein JQX13_38050 [Archangium violaceum]